MPVRTELVELNFKVAKNAQLLLVCECMEVELNYIEIKIIFQDKL